MHPNLLNNSIFLRYYKQWQDDPESIVFAPLADFFLRYQMLDDALKICRAGLKRHPRLISGRLVMARIHLARGNWDEAEDEVRYLLQLQPENEAALALGKQVERLQRQEAHGRSRADETSGAPLPVVRPAAHAPEVDDDLPPGWRTITMAQILTNQGHVEKARRIYETILHGDPGNEAARRGLQNLAELPISNSLL